MRRILVLLASLELGGAERVMTTLFRHLPREHFELHVALVAAKGRLLEELPAHVTVHDLQAERARHLGRPLIRLARRLQPDRIVSTLGHVNLALLMTRPFLGNVPVIVREANHVSAELAAGEAAVRSQPR